MKDITIPPANCPYCGYHIDRTKDAYGNAKPSKGDASICLKCGKLAVFNENLTIRIPTPEELEELIEDPKITMAQLVRAHVISNKLDEQQMTIDNDTEHAIALSCVEVLMGHDPEPGTQEGDMLDDLAHAIEHYETTRWPITHAHQFDADGGPCTVCGKKWWELQ